jgi:hypothetical protein
MKTHKASKSAGKVTKSKHVNKKRLLKTFGLLLGLLLVVALGLFLIQQYNSTYPTEGIAGKAYSDLSSEQKQMYWGCYKEKGCGILLKEAQANKNYASYRTCSKDCHAQALSYSPQQDYCQDSDGLDYFTVGNVTSNFYLKGKEDYCLEINGKNYLFEGKCVNNKAQFVQKNCAEMGEYGCEGGKCVEKGKLSNAVDTLVIVNSDDFPDLTVDKVDAVFQLAEGYWLFPKTQTKFNILGVKYYSFSKKDWKKWLTEYFLQGDKIYPEYIVIFEKEPIYGGYQSQYELEYMLNFYDLSEEIIYCNEFKPSLEEYGGAVIPATLVDYGHKFAACGYNEDYTQIISDKGLCKGEETSCIWKNGYQMCSNMQDSFYAQNTNYFTANTIVHELLHSYANDSIELEHFSTPCAYNKLGWNPEFSFDYYLQELDAIEPFDDIIQEYANICPYVWQQFIGSQQICDKEE